MNQAINCTQPHLLNAIGPDATTRMAQSSTAQLRAPQTVDGSIPESSESDADANSSPPASVDCGPSQEWLSYIIVGAVLIFLTWSLVSILLEGYWSSRLARDGVAVKATVLHYQPEQVRYRSGRRGPVHTYVSHMHRVSLHNGLETRHETLRLDRQYAIGAKVWLLYLPDKKGFVVAIDEDRSVVRIFFSRLHGYKFLWFLMWVKLIITAVLGTIFGDAEGVSRAAADAAVQAFAGVQSD